jgi:DNA-directed RNA polymerase III subunit RPC1
MDFFNFDSIKFFVIQTNETDMAFAERVKARIEKTTLKDVAKYIEEISSFKDHFLVIKLDIEKIKLLQLEVDIISITNA